MPYSTLEEATSLHDVRNGCVLNEGTKPITVDYKWNAFARIIDVGGAYGSFLQNLLEVNKEPAGLLFDQAQVCSLLLACPLRQTCCWIHQGDENTMCNPPDSAWVTLPATCMRM